MILLGMVLCLKLFSNDYQTEDNMLSTYKKNDSDGYSWRYRDITYSSNSIEITKEKLLSTIWVSDPLKSFQVILVFYKDDVFKIGTRQAGVEITGSFTISKNQVDLSSYQKNEFAKQHGLSVNNTSSKFKTDKNEIFYQDYLEINGYKYFAVGSEHKNGDELINDGINMIIDSRVQVMNDNVNFRTKPSLKAELIPVEQYSEITSDRITSIKKGTKVFLIAKTKKVETIQEVNAPWYYIKISDGYEWFQYGWVFGGYFIDYDKDKESEYWKMIVSEINKKK